MQLGIIISNKDPEIMEAQRRRKPASARHRRDAWATD